MAPIFLNYNLGVIGDDKELIIDALEKMHCITVKKRLGQSQVEMIADHNAILSAVQNNNYEKL